MCLVFFNSNFYNNIINRKKLKKILINLTTSFFKKKIRTNDFCINSKMHNNKVINRKKKIIEKLKFLIKFKNLYFLFKFKH